MQPSTLAVKKKVWIRGLEGRMAPVISSREDAERGRTATTNLPAITKRWCHNEVTDCWRLPRITRETEGIPWEGGCKDFTWKRESLDFLAEADSATCAIQRTGGPDKGGGGYCSCNSGKVGKRRTSRLSLEKRDTNRPGRDGLGTNFQGETPHLRGAIGEPEM